MMLLFLVTVLVLLVVGVFGVLVVVVKGREERRCGRFCPTTVGNTIHLTSCVGQKPKI